MWKTLGGSVAVITMLTACGAVDAQNGVGGGDAVAAATPAASVPFEVDTLPPDPGGATGAALPAATAAPAATDPPAAVDAVPAAPALAPVAPPPAARTCGAPPNPWGFNFCGGSTITSPPEGFCSVFSCIPNFPKGKGYVEQCRDGMYSLSGGRPGVCSYHRGANQPLYA